MEGYYKLEGTEVVWRPFIHFGGMQFYQKITAGPIDGWEWFKSKEEAEAKLKNG